MKKLIILLVLFFCAISAVDYSFRSGKLDEFLDNNADKTWVPKVEYYLGFFASIFGKTNSAISRFTAVVEKYPDTKYGPASQYNIAKIYDDLNRKADAVREYRKLMNLFPESPYAEPSRKRLEFYQ